LIGLQLTLLLLGGFTHGLQAQENSAPWKFVLLSDTQGDNKERVGKSCINDRVLQTTAEDIAKETPDFVLVAGDLVNGWFRNGGTDYPSQFANWKSAMKSVYQARIPVFPVRGNHESGPDRVVCPSPAHLEPPPGTPLTKASLYRTFQILYLQNGPEGEGSYLRFAVRALLSWSQSSMAIIHKSQSGLA
jgi:predicted MPP superfamily phosphohydrolase